MLGYRDSEVCVVFEDTVMIEGKMDGKPYPVGEFCHGLRCYLFRYIHQTYNSFPFSKVVGCLFSRDNCATGVKNYII